MGGPGPCDLRAIVRRMLTHMVMFDFEDPADADEAIRMLVEMAPRIEVVEDLRVGRDVIGSERSFDVGLVVTLPDRAALDVYSAHPAHLPVLEFIRARASRSAAVDFEG